MATPAQKRAIAGFNKDYKMDTTAAPRKSMRGADTPAQKIGGTAFGSKGSAPFRHVRMLSRRSRRSKRS